MVAVAKDGRYNSFAVAGVDMTTYSWIVVGLGAFDALILTLWFLILRSQVFPDRKNRVITGIALSGFVFHAVLFFEGPILYLQLATLVVIYLGLALWPLPRQPANGEIIPEPRLPSDSL
jgi:hypothetical protein